MIPEQKTARCFNAAGGFWWVERLLLHPADDCVVERFGLFDVAQVTTVLQYHGLAMGQFFGQRDAFMDGHNGVIGRPYHQRRDAHLRQQTPCVGSIADHFERVGECFGGCFGRQRVDVAADTRTDMCR